MGIKIINDRTGKSTILSTTIGDYFEHCLIELGISVGERVLSGDSLPTDRIFFGEIKAVLDVLVDDWSDADDEE